MNWPWRTRELPVADAPKEKPWSDSEEEGWKAEASFKPFTGEFTYVIAFWLVEDGEDVITEMTVNSDCASLELFAERNMDRGGNISFKMDGRKYIVPSRSLIYCADTSKEEGA